MTKRAVPIDPFPPYPREASLTTRVTWVRIRRAVGGRMVDLCRETGLRPSEVWRLLRGQAPRPRLSAAEAAERAEYVRRRRASGAAWETIAGETGLSRVTVRKLAQLADEHIALHYAPRLLRVEAYRCPNGHRVRYRPCLVCALGGALGLPEPIVERLIAQRRYIEDPDRQKHRPAPRVNARRYALALARRAPPHPGAAGKPGALVARIRAAAESSGLTPHVVRHIWLVDSIRRRAVRDARAALRGSDHPLAAAALAESFKAKGDPTRSDPSAQPPSALPELPRRVGRPTLTPSRLHWVSARGKAEQRLWRRLEAAQRGAARGLPPSVAARRQGIPTRVLLLASLRLARSSSPSVPA